jgi:adenylate kinase family enzyme
MKINILGASGSGVTTLGLSLSKSLDITYLDSDDYFWEKSEEPFTIRKNKNQRNELIKNKISELDNFIIGGSIIDWGEKVFPKFDLIIFLWIPNENRIERLKKREINKYGIKILNETKRKDKFSQFIKWANDYDYCEGIANRNIKSHENWLKQQKGKILELRENLTNEERIIIIKNYCRQQFDNMAGSDLI